MQRDTQEAYNRAVDMLTTAAAVSKLPMTMNEIAASANISRALLYRMLKEEYGSDWRTALGFERVLMPILPNIKKHNEAQAKARLGIK